jgi:hypothetical protein
LDLGAGGGDDLRIAGEVQSEARLNGIEAYPPYARKLRKEGIKVFSLNIEKDRLPFANGKVDVILMNQVLEHTKEVFWIFHEISRVFPVGGKIILGVPNMAALHNRILLGLGRQPSPCKTNSAHVRGFTKGDILSFLDCGGKSLYRLKAFGGANFYPFPPIMARPLAALFPTLAWGIFFLLEKSGPYQGEFLEFPVREKLETNFYLGPGRP